MGGGRHCERGDRTTAEVIVSVDVAARDGHGGCRIELTRLLDGCVAAAASDAAERVYKLLQGSYCSVVTWPRSLVVCVDAAGAFTDIHTSCCTPLVQLSLDLSVLNHSGRARNSLLNFGLTIKCAALCHSSIFPKYCGVAGVHRV